MSDPSAAEPIPSTEASVSASSEPNTGPTGADAIITERQYQPARDPAWAFNELRRCAGTQFDPEIARVLEEILTQHHNTLSTNSSMVA